MNKSDYNGVVNIANFALETKSDLDKVKQELDKVSQENEHLRVELEKNSKVLEVYKKALDLAINDVKKFCDSNENNNNDCGCCPLHGRCPLYGSCECIDNGDWEADYLQKAREE